MQHYQLVKFCSWKNILNVLSLTFGDRLGLN